MFDSRVIHFQGKYGACVCVLHACAQFGEMALMDEATGARRAATVVATEEAHTLVVPKSLYDGVLRARQQLEMRDKVSDWCPCCASRT